MRLDGRLLLDAVTVTAAALAAAYSLEPETWRLFILCSWTWAAVAFARWHRYGYTAGEVLVLAVVLRFIFLLTPPTLSDDYFRYVWDGMVQHAGINPFLLRPDDAALAGFHAEPLFASLNSADFYSVYPPASQVAFYMAGFFYDLEFGASVLAMRILFAAAEFAAVLVLLRCVPPSFAALYALHPLAVIELAGELHTETLMVLFLMVALWGWQRDRPRWMVAGIVLAGLVKLYPFFLLPFALRRAGFRDSVPGLLLGLAVCLPYASVDAVRNMWASLDLYVRFFEFNAGPYYALKQLGYLVSGQDLSKTIGPDLRNLFLATLPVIYVVDRLNRWRLPLTVFTVFAAFFVLSTTLHPWYLLGMLVVVPWLPHVSYAWLFLAAASIGSYERYLDGFYWEVTAVSWSVFLLIALVTHRQSLLTALQRFRAQRKADFVVPYLNGKLRNGSPRSVADIGAGEGFVGEEIARRLKVDVELLDVIDLNRTTLRHSVFDGTSIPCPDGAFDAAILIFVLHHAESPERLVAEAMRVTDGPVIVVESVYRSKSHQRVLEALDRIVNRVRSGGRMIDQEAHLRFRRAAEWRATFERLGYGIRAEATRGRFIHLQHLFVLGPPRTQ